MIKARAITSTWAKSRDDLITAARRRVTIAAGARHPLAKALVPVLRKQVTQAATHIETSGNKPAAFRELWEQELISAKRSLATGFAREGYRLGELDVGKRVQAKEFFGKAPYADDLIDRRLRQRLDAYLAKTSRLETDTTIDKLTELYNDGITDGLTTTEIAHTFLDEGASVLAGLDRADLMARCMTSWSYNNGSMEAYKDAGYHTELLASTDACETCLPMNGKIADEEGLFDGEEFPFHPNDRCTVIPVTTDESDEEEGKADPEDGTWITVHGQHIFLKNGADVQNTINAALGKPIVKHRSRDIETSSTWMEKQGTPYNEMTDAQQNAVGDYRAGGAWPINIGLRSGNMESARSLIEDMTEPEQKEAIQNWKNEVASLDSLCEHGIPLSEDATLWRGMKPMDGTVWETNPESLIGKTFQDKGFMSTTPDRNLATHFLRGIDNSSPEAMKSGILMKLTVPKGTRGFNAMEHTTMPEWVMQRGSSVKISKVERQGGLVIVSGEVVQ